MSRKHLPHEVPPVVLSNPEGEVFFITICCEPRGENQLAKPHTWDALVETIGRREAAGDLKCRLLVAMPDHLHALFMFPGSKGMKQIIGSMKSWLAKAHAIRWQRDFFDHRLRGHESAEEKGKYIRLNPVRAGLVVSPEDWPYRLERFAETS
jgi:putative transposase